MSEILVMVLLEITISIMSAVIGSNSKYDWLDASSNDGALFGFFVTLAAFILINFVGYKIFSKKSTNSNSIPGLVVTVLGGGFGAYIGMEEDDVTKTSLTSLCCCSDNAKGHFQNACCASIFFLVVVIIVQFFTCIYLL